MEQSDNSSWYCKQGSKRLKQKLIHILFSLRRGTLEYPYVKQNLYEIKTWFNVFKNFKTEGIFSLISLKFEWLKKCSSDSLITKCFLKLRQVERKMYLAIRRGFNCLFWSKRLNRSFNKSFLIVAKRWRFFSRVQSYLLLVFALIVL